MSVLGLLRPAVTLLLLSLSSSCGSTGSAQESEITGRESLVEIPGGSFLFGATESQFTQFVQASTVRFPGMEEELRKQFVIPPRMENLPTFYIDQFEVTNQAFSKFVEESGYEPEDRSDYLKHWTSPGHYPDWAADFPVIWVSQQDAQEFCEWQGKRLPTDKEWEKAARGTSGNLFPWGNENPTRETANYMRSQLEPFGNRPGDVSPYQVYDMAGNAAEITSTTRELESYTAAIARGGSFKTQSREMSTFHRFFIAPDGRYENVGFRCASDRP